jgi:hypothetical protein
LASPSSTTGFAARLEPAKSSLRSHRQKPLLGLEGKNLKGLKEMTAAGILGAGDSGQRNVLWWFVAARAP